MVVDDDATVGWLARFDRSDVLFVLLVFSCLFRWREIERERERERESETYFRERVRAGGIGRTISNRPPFDLVAFEQRRVG